MYSTFGELTTTEVRDIGVAKILDELHLDQSAASRVPIEIWIAIFEFLTEDQWDVDIYDQSYAYRHAINQTTRAIHLVCRKWRDAATMINCINYRHPTFSNLIQGEDGLLINPNSPLIHVYRFARFAKRMVAEMQRQPNERHKMQSFYIQRAKRYETPRNEADIILGKAFQSLLPTFSHLTEFACHMFISVEEFDVFTAITAHSLRKLSVDFDYRLPGALHLFNRLSKLEGLSLSIIQHLRLSATRARPILPNLRRFELHASRWDFEYALDWMAGLKTHDDEGLQVFRLSGDFDDGPTIQNFFQKQGQKIHTLSLYNSKFTAGVLQTWPLPSLHTLELGIATIALDNFLALAPPNITHLIFYNTRGEETSLFFYNAVYHVNRVGETVSYGAEIGEYQAVC